MEMQETLGVKKKKTTRGSGCAGRNLPSIEQLQAWLANSGEHQISIAGFNFEGYKPQFPVPKALELSISS